MTAEQLYESTLIKANRNKGTQNVSFDKPRWVPIINENVIRRIEALLEKKNDDDIRELQEIISKPTKLQKIEDLEDRTYFKLPKDYLDISSSYVIASDDKCSKQKLYLWEYKDQNYGEVYPDSNNKPSLEYEDSFYAIQNNHLVVFKDTTFKLDEAYLTYYKYPPKIDIEGYINLEGNPSQNRDPIMSDRFMIKVINMAVADFARNNQDAQAVNLNRERIVTDY